MHSPHRSSSRCRAGRLALALLVLCSLGPLAVAAEDLAYQEPPREIVDIVDARRTPAALPSPGGDWLLLLERPPHPSIAQLAERELRLAGLRIRPANDGPSRTMPFLGMELLRVADGARRAVNGLPASPRIENVSWSPDGSRIAFTHATGEGNELWVVEVASGGARALTGPKISLVTRKAPYWLSDGSALVAALVPAERGAEPAASRVPKGPVTQENLGRVAPSYTYQDMLASPYDEELFAHYLTAQVARIGLDGSVRELGEPGLVWQLEPSPDGRFLLVGRLHRPFSYRVPAWYFPLLVEVWDAASGELVHRLVDLPLRDSVPTAYGSVPAGPREIHWRSDAPATLVWVEALDGGDAAVEAAERDRLFQLAAPFTGERQVLATLALRFEGVTWGHDELALLDEWWWSDRRLRTWRLRPGKPGAAAELVFDRTFEDRYADPGSPVTTTSERGRKVLLTTRAGNDVIYLVGDGASPQGDRPFLDRRDLATGRSERLLHSQAPFYERPIEVLDRDATRVLTLRESVTQPPNFLLRDLRQGQERQLTSFPHPYPGLAGVTKELVRYRRHDGVQLTGKLYLPPGWQAERDGPLPMVMWAYPQEFKSADAAGQVTDSPYRFDWVGWWSPLVWLARGYAVLDDPTLPIVGEGDEEPNDTYVEQLVAGARAAVDEMVRRGVADPRRIAIGGHSYGAFMTANLLAHSDLFAAGIAQSGAFNRTLTPFGFQAEERTFWQSPETYIRMSPFMHADAIDEPLLLVHGQADNNQGTFPLQSERFYDALKALGGTTRLVLLPHESHGYQARESILHLLWENDRWLGTYVRDRAEEEEEPPTAPVVVPATE
jgi:dipeptidyl aminopeptidase/acylaminoacyl peptidase